MRERWEKLLWIAVPATVGGVVTATGNPKQDTALVMWGIVAVIAMLGIYITSTWQHRRERDRLEAERAERMEGTLAKLDTTIKDQAMTTYRIAIYDSHFSVDEKLEAYSKYKALGGNHKTKAYMDELIGEDVDGYLDKHPIR